MKISAKIDYACRALIELSLHWPSKSPLQIHHIADRQDIPIKFLTHILINLKQLGYVESIRGKSGGYMLTRKPKEISLSDVIIQMGGLGINSRQDQDSEPQNVLEAIWRDVDTCITEKLSEIDFESICNKVRSQDQAFMFEI